jgi:hypothetical protein
MSVCMVTGELVHPVHALWIRKEVP